MRVFINMFKPVLLNILLILGLGFPLVSQAGGAGDIISILEKTYGIDEDMLDSDNIMAGLQGDLKELSDSQLDAIIGNYGYGNLLNSSEDLAKRQWSPNTWSDALNGTGSNSDNYQALVNDYQEEHPSLSREEVSEGASDAYAQDYQQMVENNQAANVQATYTFNELNEHLDNIKEISEELEKTDGTKATADLNVRMNTEIAYLMVEQIKATTVLNEQVAQMQSSRIVDRTGAAQVNQIPDE